MKKSLLVITCILSSLAANALTFEQAAQSASDNASEVKVLKLEAESAKWNERKAFAGYMPKLEVDARHLVDEKLEELVVPFNGQTFTMPAIQPYTALGVTLSINVFDGLKTTNEFQAALREKEMADFKLKRAQEQKRTEIRTLFYKALGSQVLVNVANENISTLESHLNDVSFRIRSGVATRYDSLRVEVQLEDAKTEKTAAESGVVIARAKLFEAIGIADDGKALEGQLPEDFAKIDVNKIELKQEERSDRQALVAYRDSTENKASAAMGHWMPAVSLFGNYEWYNNINHSVNDGNEQFKTAYALGFSLSWNLFDGGEKYSSQKQAALAEKIASEKLSKFDTSAVVGLEEAKRRFTYDVTNYNAKLSSIRKAEEAVRLARGGLKAGTRTNTEILDTVVDLNRARASAVKSQVDAIEALGELELSVGHPL
ncbi:MAG: TolC family protein [Pseudobdellovibrio sp.]